MSGPPVPESPPPKQWPLGFFGRAHDLDSDRKAPPQAQYALLVLGANSKVATKPYCLGTQLQTDTLLTIHSSLLVRSESAL